MTPYEILIEVLDRLRAEAPTEYRSYHDESTQESLNAARSKAFLHLFLKAKCGLLTFQERELFITDGADDAGIDAFHIDHERKVIQFLQAKFRMSEKNFEGKTIAAEELLMMDVGRILQGETVAENGNRYNPKVQKMIGQIKGIKDIGRYTYRVVVLANATGVTRRKLNDLTGGFPAELIDYRDCYTSLMFPLISGTYYAADELRISLSLSNKSAGAKISYTVNTEFTKCEITVVFIPTLEIAKVMFKYRNSILQFNPRSYLGHEGKAVNGEIRKSIESRQTNEFALFNNGITILSDETCLNERIGQKDRAQLVLMNPQIINGGQTAYTLSVIYRENMEEDSAAIFGEKEVLVKIITFEDNDLSEDKKLSLIDDISRATNQQSVVTIADRRANEGAVIELQRRLFEIGGVFLERKRGEFEDGLREGYIQSNEILDRTLLFRAAFAVRGLIRDALQDRIVAKADYSQLINVSDTELERYAFAVLLLNRLLLRPNGQRRSINASLLCKTFLATLMWFKPGMPIQMRDALVIQAANDISDAWDMFVKFVDVDFLEFNNINQRKKSQNKIQNYFTGARFPIDLANFIRICNDCEAPSNDRGLGPDALPSAEA